MTAEPQTILNKLSARAAECEPYLPEAGGNLSLLMRDLASLTRLGLPRDRRLMGIDLENLAEGVDRIVAFRQEGHDPEELAPAALDLSRLILDMRARAAKALRSAAQEVAIHAEVSALGTRESVGPADLTREFRLIAAAPAPAKRACDAPASLLPTGLADAGEVFGRVSGAYVYYALKDSLAHNAAPAEARVLPAGSVIHLDAGESVRLFTRGLTSGDRYSKPSGKEIQIVIVEAERDGATVYGPALVAPGLDVKGAVAVACRDVREADQGRKHQTRLISSGDDRYDTDPLGALLVSSVLTVTAALTVAAAITFLPQPVRVFAAVAVVIAALAGAWEVGRRGRKAHAERMRAFADAVPARAASGDAATALRIVAGRHAPDSVPETNGFIPSDFAKMSDRFGGGTGANFYPLTHIAAPAGEGLRVMRPLPALPSPTEFADVLRQTEKAA